MIRPVLQAYQHWTDCVTCNKQHLQALTCRLSILPGVLLGGRPKVSGPAITIPPSRCLSGSSFCSPPASQQQLWHNIATGLQLNHSMIMATLSSLPWTTHEKPSAMHNGPMQNGQVMQERKGNTTCQHLAIPWTLDPAIESCNKAAVNASWHKQTKQHVSTWSHNGVVKTGPL